MPRLDNILDSFEIFLRGNLRRNILRERENARCGYILLHFWNINLYQIFVFVSSFFSFYLIGQELLVCQPFNQ